MEEGESILVLQATSVLYAEDLVRPLFRYAWDRTISNMVRKVSVYIAEELESND